MAAPQRSQPSERTHPVLTFIVSLVWLGAWTGVVFFLLRVAGWPVTFWRSLAVIGLTQVLLIPTSLFAVAIVRAIDRKK